MPKAQGLRCSVLAFGIAVALVVSPFVPSRRLRADAPALGRIAFPTSGSPSAQPPFIHGVLLLHSFEYDDAIQAFREAERIDPSFAMAYWGEAMCDNQPLWFHETLDKGRDALTRLRAARAARRVTAREDGYVDAIERLFGAGDKPVRDRAWATIGPEPWAEGSPWHKRGQPPRQHRLGNAGSTTSLRGRR